MELEEVLLDSQSRTKLAILSYLMEHPGRKVYYSDIQKHITISRLKFNLLVAEMNTEIEELFDFSLQPFQHVLYLEADQSCFNTYMRFLIHRGLPYQFILSTLIDPEARMDSFLMDHFVSRSTVTRALKPLKTYAEGLALKVNYSKVSFSGNEGKLRYLYMKVLWLGSLGEDIKSDDLDFIAEKKLVKQLNDNNFSNVSADLIILHLAISKVRSLQGHVLRKVTGCESLYPQITCLLDDYYQKFMDDSSQVASLTNAFKYQFVFAFYYSSNQDSRLPEIAQFYEELKYTEPVFIKFFEAFFVFTESQLLNNSVELLLKDKANLFSVVYLHYLTKGDMIMFLGFDLEEARQNRQYKVEDFQMIQRDIQKFFRPYLRREVFVWLKKHSTELSRSLTFVIYPYHQKRVEQKVKILITPVLNYLALQHVALFLDRLDFVDYSTNPQDISNADIILSNFNENISETEIPVFIFQMNNQEKNLVDLFQLLWQSYQRKNAQ